MKKWIVCFLVCLVGFPLSTLAAKKKMVQPQVEPEHAQAPAGRIPQTSLFVGLGGSYNSLKLDQNLTVNSTSNITFGIFPVASGQAGGAATPFHDTQSLFAPEAQIGYFKHFCNSSRLWGVKFLYRYLGATATDRDIDSFPSSALAVSGPDIINANVFVQAAQTNINHELALLFFIGESFTNSYVYVGVGPVLINAETKLYNVTGTFDVNNFPVNTLNSPATFANSQWLWGGAIQLGMTYYLNPTWFIDFNYTYAMTSRDSNSNSGTFTNDATGLGLVNTGSLHTNNSQRITAQAATVSINKLFDL